MSWAAIVLTWRLTALWGALSARCFLGSKEPRQYSKSHISMFIRITNVLTSSRVKNKDALRKLKWGRDIVLCFSSRTVRYSNQTVSWIYNQNCMLHNVTQYHSCMHGLNRSSSFCFAKKFTCVLYMHSCCGSLSSCLRAAQCQDQGLRWPKTQNHFQRGAKNSETWFRGSPSSFSKAASAA